ncbi:GGDEF domain-containing protein [Thiomicrorhabdus sediminis]|uniref:diguanylate cyclase n=1 Tax=Thiomicrorhabdus sediminis TaxID=2580412 RepID=A0A4P9K4K6_9GAMM|nr:GGDEF domain-containing protein [Thiomicrorhabdus sediminis]QCU89872.1 GGDEF domain-containing protein [Thiomicrorhabdus sediminis]
MPSSVRRFVLMIIATAFFLPNTQAAESIKVQLRWLHQFQFAGYYMALEKGYYANYALDVELIEGGPNSLKPIDDVLEGKVDFAITGSGVVIDRMEGKPVVAVAAIMQTSPIVWISLKSSNIRSPIDLANKRLLIMPPPESAELLTMLKHEGIDIDQLDIRNTSYRIEDLIDNKADAYDGYISNEPYYLKQRGIEYNLINPREYGINFYSDVLITSQTFAKNQPELVEHFKAATLKGWEYALDNIEETVQLIHNQYAPQKTLDHLRFEAQTLKKLIMPELVQVGHMNPGRWQFIANSYQQLNMTQADAGLKGFLFEADFKPNYTLAINIALGSALLLLIAALIIFKFRKLSQQLHKSNQLLAQQALIDQLTQVRNRRGFLEQAKTVLSQANREQSHSSFLMFDIDNFKQINDRYGHSAGDAALIKFANMLSSHRRQQDIVARIGGEEFAMLLIDADIKSAEKIAKRILEDIRHAVIESPNSDNQFNITASIGIAAAHGSIEEFCEKADKALYQAKHNGRNQIVIAE